ncbi:MAG: SAM-dependent chlorinase/fluorinase [Rhodospirillales bacterium]|nr:SAM-dependent chlorinase/fluorinase [Rhodospirillales bacterium]
MIVLFTDFGHEGPYIGQMQGVLHAEAPGLPQVNLMADAPAANPKAAAYLLSAFCAGFPAGSVFLCVVDPGVGSNRRAGVLLANDRWFVGPDNGLFELLVRRAEGAARWWEIDWRPERMSASFHGRDLFAPIAGRLATAITKGEREHPPGCSEQNTGTMFCPDWPDDLAEVVYVDRFGNAVTGLRVSKLSAEQKILIAGKDIIRASTFSDVPPATPFWYENSNGLLEIAVNQGRADQSLGLDIGVEISLN